MKRVIMLCTTLVLLSCSNDSNNSVNSSTVFHPPAWVHGTWTYDAGGQQMGLKFSSDNVCTVTNTTANCYKEVLVLYTNTQVVTDVNEEISDTEYKVEVNIGGSILTYDVSKVSSTKISWKINSSSTVTLNKQ